MSNIPEIKLGDFDSLVAEITPDNSRIIRMPEPTGENMAILFNRINMLIKEVNKLKGKLRALAIEE